MRASLTYSGCSESGADRSWALRVDGDGPWNALLKGPVMVDDPAELGARLRQLREDANLSQAKLGREIGVTRAHISLVENGRAGLTLPRLQAWLEVCGGSLDGLVADEHSTLADQIRRLPPKRYELVLLLVDVVQSASDRFVDMTRGVLESLYSFEREREAEEEETEGREYPDQRPKRP